MALVYVGGTSGAGTGASYAVSLSGTLTGGVASSPSVGDLIIVAVGESNGGTVTSTLAGNNSGAYPTITSHVTRADTYDANLDTFYLVASGTVDTSLTVTRGNNNTTYGSSTVVHVWRHADPTTPFDGVTPTTANAANASTADPPAITPNTVGACVIAIGHGTQTSTGTAFTTAGGSYLVSKLGDGSTSDSDTAIEAYPDWTSGSVNPSAFPGSTTTTACAWAAVTIAIRPQIESASGALTGQGSTVVGSASRATPAVNHANTGALIGQGSTLSGAASSATVRPSSGVLVGSGSTVVGSASRAAAIVTHDTSGTLTGSGSTVAGASTRFHAFATSGAVTGPGSNVVGISSRVRVFDTSGALTGAGSSVSGAADSSTTRTSTGSLVGQGSTVTGSASRDVVVVEHTTSGGLTGQGSTVSGAAAQVTDFTFVGEASYTPPASTAVDFNFGGAVSHDTSGALSGSGSNVIGSATRFRSFATSGVIIGDAAIVTGSAARSGSVVSHDTSGSIVSIGSSLSGAAINESGQPQSWSAVGMRRRAFR